jgi:pyridoxine 5-phosphate synthase
MTRVSVNVNKIATLRNTRQRSVPDLLRLSALALQVGTHGITVHPRPDERHIRATDVCPLAEVVRRYPGAELNIEGNPRHGLLEHCERARPAQATLVPDERDAPTSNRGWDLLALAGAERRALASSVEQLHVWGIRVSLFVAPDPALMPSARELGADRVELYTEPYAGAAAQGEGRVAAQLYARAADAARRAGLGVNAGHDLSLDNLGELLQYAWLDEVSVGHAFVAESLELGLAEAARRYLALCARTRSPHHGPADESRSPGRQAR